MKTGTFYEINITKKGIHVFATDSTIRSYNDSQILKLLKLFKLKFPESEDYQVSVTAWHCGAPVLPKNVKEFISENWTGTPQSIPRYIIALIHKTLETFVTKKNKLK
jgi:hypothetical protein